MNISEVNNEIQNWKYEESVKLVKPMVFKWKNLTVDIVRELWIARQVLDGRGGDRRSINFSNVTNVTFENYCDDIGISRMTVHRWLERFIPEENKLLTREELEAKKQIEYNKKLNEEELIKKLSYQYLQTGEKPVGWKEEYEKDYLRLKKEEEERTKRIELFKQKNEEVKKARERERKIFENDNDNDENNKDIEKELLTKFILDSSERNKLREKIQSTHIKNQDVFFDIVIDEYLMDLSSDTLRLEALHNIIKYCKIKINEYQVKSLN